MRLCVLSAVRNSTKPDDPDQYLYQGNWRPFDIVSETIEVAGAASVTVKLKYSIAGPVVSESPANHSAVAVRLTAMEPGAANALQFLPSNFATSWVDFTKGDPLRGVRHELSLCGCGRSYRMAFGRIGAGSVAPRRPTSGTG
jgi:hypothetical protein